MIPKMQTLGIIKTSQTAKVELPKLLIFILDFDDLDNFDEYWSALL